MGRGDPWSHFCGYKLTCHFLTSSKLWELIILSPSYCMPKMHSSSPILIIKHTSLCKRILIAEMFGTKYGAIIPSEMTTRNLDYTSPFLVEPKLVVYATLETYGFAIIAL